MFLASGLLATWCGCRMIRMPGKSFRGPLPPLTQEQAVLRDELRRHVEKLGHEIGERNVYRPRQLREAADYLEEVFTNAGCRVDRQGFTAMGEHCDNLEAEIRGRNRPEEIVVVGAHYDSVSGSPGANDNGSGIASVLALARVWAGREPSRTVRFVAFVNEEPPFFQTDRMGSLVYARRCRERGDNIVAMLALETMGCYRTEKGSQRYPFPVGLFYPSRGDFIAFVGNTANSRLVRWCVRTFRERASFPSEGAALPGLLPGIAPFRYAHYHSIADTPDKIDHDRLARVVDGLDRVIEELAGAGR